MFIIRLDVPGTWQIQSFYLHFYSVSREPYDFNLASMYLHPIIYSINFNFDKEACLVCVRY